MAKYAQEILTASDEATIKMGTAEPPYTIYASGGFSADTVAVQSGPESAGPFNAEFGPMSPAGEYLALALANGFIAVIEHKVEYIKLVAGGSLVGTAVVEIVTPS